MFNAVPKAPFVLTAAVLAAGLLGVAPTSLAGHQSCEIVWDVPAAATWSRTLEEWSFRWHHPTYYSSGSNQCLPAAGFDSYHQVQRSWATGSVQVCGPIGNIGDAVCNYTDPAAPDGAHTVTARVCAPGCGAWSTSPVHGLDRAPPAATLVSTDTPEVVDGVRLADGSFSVTVTGSDATSGVDQVSLVAYRFTHEDRVLVSNVLVSASGPGTHTLTFDPPSTWAGKMTVVVTDVAGHASAIEMGTVIIP